MHAHTHTRTGSSTRKLRCICRATGRCDAAAAAAMVGGTAGTRWTSEVARSRIWRRRRRRLFRREDGRRTHMTVGWGDGRPAVTPRRIRLTNVVAVTAIDGRCHHHTINLRRRKYAIPAFFFFFPGRLASDHCPYGQTFLPTVNPSSENTHDDEGKSSESPWQNGSARGPYLCVFWGHPNVRVCTCARN